MVRVFHLFYIGIVQELFTSSKQYDPLNLMDVNVVVAVGPVDMWKSPPGTRLLPIYGDYKSNVGCMLGLNETNFSTRECGERGIR